MEFEDSRFALFPEPNAFIQNFNNESKKEIKKIIFQEPYETLPNYYVNNNFTKHNCDCALKSKKDDFFYKHVNHNCNCNHGNNHDTHIGSDFRNEHDKNNHNNNCNNNKQNGLGFDIKNLMPLLSLFNKGGGVDLSSLVGMLNNKNNNETANNPDPAGIISSLISNKDALTGVLNFFKGGGLNLFNKKQALKKELKTTDFEIKNYTRVY